MMNITFVPEPELEFGAGKHIDIRFGIMNYGPLDVDSSLAPKDIALGIIGTKESIEGAADWFQKCKVEVSAKVSKQPNLFPRFPGFDEDRAFYSRLVIDPSLCRDLPKTELLSLGAIKNRKLRIEKAVQLFVDEIKYLAQNTAAKVIVCALPLILLPHIAPAPKARSAESEDEPQDVIGGQVDFHDMLKANAMSFKKPIQLILPSTYDESARGKQKKSGLVRTLQDEATRAWNIHSALYYKAGGTPWRLERSSSDLTVCYIGISFYKSLDRSKLLTSVAQVFNERGEGVVVRGGAASISKEDRQVHLLETDAFGLLKDALARYRDVHKNAPARVVVHKSSSFNQAEVSGFQLAAKESNIDVVDLLHLSPSSCRLYRGGQYPPLRGTVLTLDDENMLMYPRGSVEFFETYPGKYIPVPLLVKLAQSEQTQRFLAREILSLTKMNWNKTQFDGSEPITLTASRQVSAVLRYCPEGFELEPRYSFYM